MSGPGLGMWGKGMTQTKPKTKTFAGKLLSGLGGFLGGLGGGLTSGLLGLGSSLLSNKGALRRQQLADQQNIKFWQMQNAYNTPKAQMERLKQAGLNPALIYGSGSAQTGIAGAVAPSKPAPYNVKNPVPAQALLLDAETKNIQARTLKTQAEASRILGITPADISQRSTQAKISAQRLLQEKVRTGQISKQQLAITQSLMEKAEIDSINKTYQQAYTDFKKGLIKQGIDPQGGLHTTMMKWFATLFQDKPTQPEDIKNNKFKQSQ